MTSEAKAREKIDQKLMRAGWLAAFQSASPRALCCFSNMFEDVLICVKVSVTAINLLLNK